MQEHPQIDPPDEDDTPEETLTDDMVRDLLDQAREEGLSMTIRVCNEALCNAVPQRWRERCAAIINRRREQDEIDPFVRVVP